MNKRRRSRKNIRRSLFDGDDQPPPPPIYDTNNNNNLNLLGEFLNRNRYTSSTTNRSRSQTYPPSCKGSRQRSSSVNNNPIDTDVYTPLGYLYTTSEYRNINPEIPVSPLNLNNYGKCSRKRVKKINYRGMWRPKTKAVGKMTRRELINDISKFVRAWEKVTTRNMDMSRERLNNETMKFLRKIANNYYSIKFKKMSEDWLVDYNLDIPVSSVKKKKTKKRKSIKKRKK
jgi:hypothetical protein